jgi:large subunit ribosomal protein L28
MARFCELTGKGPLVGNYVSHSNHRTRRRFLPNLQVQKFFVPELDKWIELKISTQAMRTINKKGVYQYLLELEKKGDIILNF